MEFEWIGSDKPFLDEIFIKSLSDSMHVGCFGGSTVCGATKNEDACFVMQDERESWTFCAVLDAHKSAQSAELIIALFKNNKNHLMSLFESENVFFDLDTNFVNLFSNDKFRDKCKSLSGETSCLLCFQRGQFLWWMSIGDCMVLLFHPELAKLNQYELNQRQFFEWIGESNTFELPVPCYTVGRRQLRQGTNHIVLHTDGVIDSDDGYFQNRENLYRSLVSDAPIDKNLNTILEHLRARQVKDSATIVCWKYVNEQQGLNPSD